MTEINEQFNKLVEVTLADQSHLTESNNDKNHQQPELIDMGESAKSPNFFQDNKSSVEKPERKYTTTRIKS